VLNCETYYILRASNAASIFFDAVSRYNSFINGSNRLEVAALPYSLLYFAFGRLVFSLISSILYSLTVP